jgi:hypothetical protein
LSAITWRCTASSTYPRKQCPDVHRAASTDCFGLDQSQVRLYTAPARHTVRARQFPPVRPRGALDELAAPPPGACTLVSPAHTTRPRRRD